MPVVPFVARNLATESALAGDAAGGGRVSAGEAPRLRPGERSRSPTTVEARRNVARRSGLTEESPTWWRRWASGLAPLRVTRRWYKCSRRRATASLSSIFFARSSCSSTPKVLRGPAHKDVEGPMATLRVCTTNQRVLMQSAIFEVEDNAHRSPRQCAAGRLRAQLRRSQRGWS